MKDGNKIMKDERERPSCLNDHNPPPRKRALDVTIWFDLFSDEVPSVFGRLVTLYAGVYDLWCSKILYFPPISYLCTTHCGPI